MNTRTHTHTYTHEHTHTHARAHTTTHFNTTPQATGALPPAHPRFLLRIGLALSAPMLGHITLSPIPFQVREWQCFF
jgi:carbohydrate-binding DOMON domain-containing protein